MNLIITTEARQLCMIEVSCIMLAYQQEEGWNFPKEQVYGNVTFPINKIRRIFEAQALDVYHGEDKVSNNQCVIEAEFSPGYAQVYLCIDSYDDIKSGLYGYQSIPTMYRTLN